MQESHKPQTNKELYYIITMKINIIQKKRPNARAASEAKIVGTKIAVAPEVGAGAGASAAATLWAADTAISTTTVAINSLVLIASICLNIFVCKKAFNICMQKQENLRKIVLSIRSWLYQALLI